MSVFELHYQLPLPNTRHFIWNHRRIFIIRKSKVGSCFISERIDFNSANQRSFRCYCICKQIIATGKNIPSANKKTKRLTFVGGTIPLHYENLSMKWWTGYYVETISFIFSLTVINFVNNWAKKNRTRIRIELLLFYGVSLQLNRVHDRPVEIYTDEHGSIPLLG